MTGHDSVHSVGIGANGQNAGVVTANGSGLARATPTTSSLRAAVIAQRIIDTSGAPVDDEKRIGGSIGVAFSDDSLGTPEDLIGAADQAMYDAKQRGGSGYHVANGIDDEPSPVDGGDEVVSSRVARPTESSDPGHPDLAHRATHLSRRAGPEEGPR
jgi:hypothetical protein